MSERLHVLGIRHHGPGSAFSLLRALAAIDPTIILVEGPPEADAVLSFALSPEMRPPIALLAHAADEPGIARFYPFAEYSPEWRAILWGLSHKKIVRFFDLPAAYDLARKITVDGKTDTDAEADAAESASAAALRRDPLSSLAAAAGYDDGEAWWNALIEQGVHASDLFLAIETGMSALRQVTESEGPPEDREWEDRREAHMRLEASRALKETQEAVVAVVGAWHVPALRRQVPAKEDAALLRGLPRTKVSVTWVPWTEPRLATSSGYRAGVISPAWYGALWREMSALSPGDSIDRRRLSIRWVTRAAHLIRERGLSASTASIIDTARLAETIASLRGLAMPGLAEMRDASLAAMCAGEYAPLRLIEEQLVIGTAVGEIDPSVPQMPLQADLARWQKRLRLKPEALEQELPLDLRSETGLAKSQLLHRLLLINVPWGRLIGAGGSRGTFRERWMLEWSPELSVRVAEALVWGATIEQAASGAVAERTRKATDLKTLAELVSMCLLAGLSDAARFALRALQAGASNGDVVSLIEAMPPLAQVLRYGTAREIASEELRLLVLDLGERVCVALVYACRGLDSEQAAAMRTRMDTFRQAVPLVEDQRLATDWRDALTKVAGDPQANPLLAGYAVRCLYDQSALNAEDAALRLSRALSPAQSPQAAGDWLDGFLAGGGQVLLHDDALFAAVDSYLIALSPEDFIVVLPMLRRALSSFESIERRRLLALARADASETIGESRGDAPGFDAALPLLLKMLGLS